MPDITLPEVRLPEIKLPDLRDMTMDDIQKAMPEVRLPKLELPKRSEIAREIDKAIPRRAGPSPVPFAILAMLGGLIVGWILATSPATGPRISAALDGIRGRVDRWRGGAMDELDEELGSGPAAYRDTLGSTNPSGSYAEALAAREAGVGVGPGGLAEDLDRTPEGVSSERF